MAVEASVHGMARIGPGRELKWALEEHWAGRRTAADLESTAAEIRRRNWMSMAAHGITMIPSNDFSLYDHVLDTAVSLGVVPARFSAQPAQAARTEASSRGRAVGLDLYFAMARGAGSDGGPVPALELTKWFDTNYHYLVPELDRSTSFAPDATKATSELTEAAGIGIRTRPVLVGPLTMLQLSSVQGEGSARLAVLSRMVDAYVELLAALRASGADWVQLDEPALVGELGPVQLEALERTYRRLGSSSERPKIVLSTYFGDVGQAMPTLGELPVEGIGLDFRAGPANFALLSEAGGIGHKWLFAGVVDGRNVWASDLERSLGELERLAPLAGSVVVSTSCSLMHVPVSAQNEVGLDPEIAPWLAFGEEKLAELGLLAKGLDLGRAAIGEELDSNRRTLEQRRASGRARDGAVRARVEALRDGGDRRSAAPARRWEVQEERLRLPVIPTTTIGSFPQTPELRRARAAWRTGKSSDADYRSQLQAEIDHVIDVQERAGLDVLVHGEPERDDMVRYFAAKLGGFTLPEGGWVQSYGSRCVRPPILFGDVSRPEPMTVEWACYASSRTPKPVKGMLTGPVTMLRWSFVRDDQPAADTAVQLALAIADEVADLQRSGIAVIQVDEPGLREGLPLRRAQHDAYLAWATKAFRIAVAPAEEGTQIHSHMCYAEFSDILAAIGQLEIDVISLEAARSKMATVGELAEGPYLGGVGPGVYDVHSPNVPSTDQMAGLLRQAVEALGPARVWANPDCGLKTRRYQEVVPALENLVEAARIVRNGL
ncbi:MAG: 5-methyltetrahydropteroyltriglutamate--homocysteine S-methyltransferase [Actinomycetota bacterium]|nr:5-methyltetrahydropteroyltriglutamate--homocysteine S-methyltransferase [Actinomycetota bacterium]